MFALDIDYPHTASTFGAGTSNTIDAPKRFDFQSLAPLEMVTNQFPEVSFGCAIALNPSNPRFVKKVGRRVLMPTGNDNRLSIALEGNISSFHLWGRCTQPILLKVLESSGQVVKIHSDRAFRCSDESETTLLPLQILRLENMNDIAIIELSADAPFTIEGLYV